MKKLFLTLLILILIGAGCARSGQRQAQGPVDIPQKLLEEGAVKPTTDALPDLTLTDYTGKSVRLQDFVGKPLVVNAWAAWCPFCRKELKDFATVQKELGDRVVFIAVDRAEPLSTAKRYTDELGVTNDLVFFLDPDDSFYQSIGGFSMPETIFVNAQGNIVEHKRGPMEVAEIRERTQRLLK